MGVYEVSGVIGYGGMGVILKALEPSLNRYVALKVLWPHLAVHGAARQRFAREARAAAAVVHEHVVPIYAVDEFQGIPYIVMQYVPGRSLQDRITRDGGLPLEQILRIGRQIAAALDAAHAQGLVHRDVKPANILLENGIERVLVTDFGLARTADDASLTHSGMVAGTPQFMSPEQARGELIDHRSDLFSLGSVLYTMCTGHPPFRAETLMVKVQVPLTLRLVPRSTCSCDSTTAPIRFRQGCFRQASKAKSCTRRFALVISDLWHQTAATTSQSLMAFDSLWQYQRKPKPTRHSTLSPRVAACRCLCAKHSGCRATEW